MSMFGFWRRSLCQLYHSLTEDVMVAGSPAIAGWLRSSIFSVSEVGPQLLLWKVPVPRKVSWYQDQSLGVWSLYAETWKPIQPPPLFMYVWNALRWAAVCG